MAVKPAWIIGSNCYYDDDGVESQVDENTQFIEGLVTRDVSYTKEQENSDIEGLSVKRYGNVVSIFGVIKEASVTANEETILLRLADSKPAVAVRGSCMVGANHYTPGTLSYIIVGTNGIVSITSPNGGTGKAVIVDITYIV